MLKREEVRAGVQMALGAFASGKLADNTKGFLNVLGYDSDKIYDLSPNTYAGFYQDFASKTNGFSAANAQADAWTSADIIFQVADEDLNQSQNPPLFSARALQEQRFSSLVFMAIGLRRQVIPEDKRLWELDNFELFLSERRKMLATQINEYLNNIVQTEDRDTRLSAEELIQNGESFNVELKETLRWDIRQQRVNKDLESVVLKTIAGFSNVQGGILFIGVTDEQEIEGLEQDYATLKGNDKDAFELHLSNLITQEYGTDVALEGVRITFPVVEDKEICMVEVLAGIKPLYTQTTDKNGVKSQKFYVRRGNSSNELSLHEISDYVARRFGSVRA